MLKRLDNIGIAASDVQRSVDFYTQKLGMEGEAGPEGGSVRLGEVALFIFKSARTDSPPVGRTASYDQNPIGIDHLAFEVEDIEQASVEYEARGIAFEGPIVGDAGSFRYRGFQDPDANMLYIIQHPG